MKVVIAISLLFLLNEVHARDLGKYGSTYTIIEPDLLEDIESKLKEYEESGKLEEFNKKYREKIKRQIRRPNRVSGITNATENNIRKFDPTTELEEDIVIPRNELPKNSNNPEKIEYETLYKAGTKINPLDYMLFNELLIFIDGKIEEQREFANSYHDKNPLAKIILINGKPGIHKVEGREYYYYFDQWGAYSSRFNIALVPSVIYQKKNEKVLTIEEVKLEAKEQK